MQNEINNMSFLTADSKSKMSKVRRLLGVSSFGWGEGSVGVELSFLAALAILEAVSERAFDPTTAELQVDRKCPRAAGFLVSGQRQTY